jgi:hypothetical protein
VVLRLIFPYIILILIVAFYIYFRHLKLGPVIQKIKRRLLSRYNADSFFLIVIITLASYFLARYELTGSYATDDPILFGPYTYIFFYGALLLVVICREAERPALREKGISSARGFWLWEQIDSYRWSKDLLTLTIRRGKRKRTEIWQVDLSTKKEVDTILKNKLPKRSGPRKKKG